MLFFVSALFHFSLSIEKKLKSKCTNITPGNLNSIRQVLQEEGIPTDLFYINLQNELNIWKYYYKVNNFPIKHINVISYDLNNAIIEEQFQFHVNGMAAMESAPFFPQKIKCFTLERWGYLWFVQQQPLKKLSKNLKQFNPKEMNSIARDIESIFRKLERNNVVVTTPNAKFSFNKSRTITIDPNNIAYFYKAEQKFYIVSDFWKNEPTDYTNFKSLIANGRNVYHKVLQAHKSLNRYMLLETLKQLYLKRASHSYDEWEKRFYLQFVNNVEDAHRQVTRVGRVYYSWLDVKGFIADNGQKKMPSLLEKRPASHVASLQFRRSSLPINRNILQIASPFLRRTPIPQIRRDQHESYLPLTYEYIDFSSTNKEQVMHILQDYDYKTLWNL